MHGINKLALGAVVALLLIGCSETDGGENQPGVSLSDISAWGCDFQAPFDLGLLVDGPTAETLPAPVRDALTGVAPPGAIVDTALDLDPAELNTWIIAHQDGENVTILRALPTESAPMEIDGRTIDIHRQYEYISVFEALAEDRQTTFWHYGSRGQCSLRAHVEGMHTPTVQLLAQPSSGDRVLRLSVDEMVCASGQKAEGRIRHGVDMNEDEVRILVTVVPLPGDFHTCPGVSPSTYELELTETVGDRAIVDMTWLPPREL